MVARCGLSTPGHLVQHAHTHTHAQPLTHTPSQTTGASRARPRATGTESYQVRLCGNVRSLFTVFVENKPACPSGWGRRGRPGAWERGGRWLPFPGCRQLAVAMAAVCFPFLPALQRKARVAACLFLNYQKVEKGLTCCAGSRFGATALAVCCSDPASQPVISPTLGLGSPYMGFGGPLRPASLRLCPILSVLSP